MRYAVGDLVVDVGRQSVSRSDVGIALPKLSFDLLLVLIRAAPNIVSLDELMRQVWPGLIVSPETVSKRVMLLRDALGEDPRAPRYIGGLRGRGYRIIADVFEVASPAIDPAVERAGGSKVAVRSPHEEGRSPTFLTARTDHSSRAAGRRFLGLSSMSALLLAAATLVLGTTSVLYIRSKARVSDQDVDVTPNVFAGTWIGKIETCSPSNTYSGTFTVAITNTNSEILHLMYYGYGLDGSISLTGTYDLRTMGRKAESTSPAGITYTLKEHDLIVDYPKTCQHGVLRRLDPGAQSMKLANQR
jgi:DNA-binding winged helix-turn-helix (wHTH) protein